MEDEIRRRITERFGSQKALAERIKVSPQAINDIVAGRTVSATARFSVASALGCEVEDLWPETAARAS